MSNNGIIKIHGKDYMTVAGRLELAKKDIEKIETQVLQFDPVVVIKASVWVGNKLFTGISSANPAKSIEASNPYEVAETSAVGRALGFAGYGVIEGIASADEMVKATTPPVSYEREATEQEELPEDTKVCMAHDEPEKMFKGQSKTKVDRDGNPKTYWWHSYNGKMCFGDGYLKN